MHISNCKKFQEKIVNVGKEAPPPGDTISKQKKSVNRMKGHNASSSGCRTKRMPPTTTSTCEKCLPEEKRAARRSPPSTGRS